MREHEPSSEAPDSADMWMVGGDVAQPLLTIQALPHETHCWCHRDWRPTLGMLTSGRLALSRSQFCISCHIMEPITSLGRNRATETSPVLSVTFRLVPEKRCAAKCSASYSC
jgi:hypothetical protein